MEITPNRVVVNHLQGEVLLPSNVNEKKRKKSHKKKSVFDGSETNPIDLTEDEITPTKEKKIKKSIVAHDGAENFTVAISRTEFQMLKEIMKQHSSKFGADDTGMTSNTFSPTVDDNSIDLVRRLQVIENTLMKIESRLSKIDERLDTLERIEKESHCTVEKIEQRHSQLKMVLSSVSVGGDPAAGTSVLICDSGTDIGNVGRTVNLSKESEENTQMPSVTDCESITIGKGTSQMERAMSRHQTNHKGPESSELHSKQSEDCGASNTVLRMSPSPNKETPQKSIAKVSLEQKKNESMCPGNTINSEKGNISDRSSLKSFRASVTQKSTNEEVGPQEPRIRVKKSAILCDSGSQSERLNKLRRQVEVGAQVIRQSRQVGNVCDEGTSTPAVKQIESPDTVSVRKNPALPSELLSMPLQKEVSSSVQHNFQNFVSANSITEPTLPTHGDRINTVTDTCTISNPVTVDHSRLGAVSSVTSLSTSMHDSERNVADKNRKSTSCSVNTVQNKSSSHGSDEIAEDSLLLPSTCITNSCPVQQSNEQRQEFTTANFQNNSVANQPTPGSVCRVVNSSLDSTCDVPVKKERLELLQLSTVKQEVPFMKDDDGRILLFVCGMAKKINAIQHIAVAGTCWNLIDRWHHEFVFVEGNTTAQSMKKLAELKAITFGLEVVKSVFQNDAQPCIMVVSSCASLVQLMRKKNDLYPFINRCDCEPQACFHHPNKRWDTKQEFAAAFPEDMPKLILTLKGLQVHWCKLDSISGTERETMQSYRTIVENKLAEESRVKLALDHKEM